MISTWEGKPYAQVGWLTSWKLLVQTKKKQHGAKNASVVTKVKKMSLDLGGSVG